MREPNGGRARGGRRMDVGEMKRQRAEGKDAAATRERKGKAKA